MDAVTHHMLLNELKAASFAFGPNLTPLFKISARRLFPEFIRNILNKLGQDLASSYDTSLSSRNF